MTCLSILLQALTVPLKDSGCLLLLPSSLFLTYGEMCYSTGTLSVPCLSHMLFCTTTIIYLHISCLFFCLFFFLGTKKDAAEILHGLFVFPDSRAVQRGDILISL